MAPNSKAAHDVPLTVEIFEGEVVLTSSQGSTAVALTPQAAAQTGRRIEAALLTLGQGTLHPRPCRPPAD